MKRYITLFIITTFFLVVKAEAQKKTRLQYDTADYPYWIEMMQDPSISYYKTVRAFNKYWENREIGRSSGYKPFKRWEYYWADRVDSKGMRRPAAEAFEAWFEFQKKNSKANTFEGNWTNLGPVNKPLNGGTGQPNGNGRINAIAFHPSDAGIIYIGAPAGGLWKTTDGGQTWSSSTDNLPTLGVSAIVVDYTNPDIMYMGTGDRDAGDAEGMGVMKSTDGGASWQFAKEGMGDVTVGRIIMHPNDNNILIAATSGGVFKTVDGGANWTESKNGNFKDVVFKTDDPTVVFATAAGKFYRSDDTGNTFVRISNGIGAASRGVIGVSPADPDVVYFVTSQNSVYAGTYKSSDAGLSFTLQSDSPNILGYDCNGGNGGQGWYDLDVAVDPDNADIVFVGGVNVFRSVNGGVTWTISSHWVGSCGVPAVHADCHVLEFSPVNGYLYAGNDGGIYYTPNGGYGWTEITSGIAISQIYKIGQSATDPDKVINGYQDNGTATFLGDTTFLTVMGGDGMDCVYDFQNSSFAYGEYYNGAGITRIFNNYSRVGISSGISEAGAWVTPLILDVTDPETMYVGMKNVWRSHNIQSGNVTWQKISDNLGGTNLKNIRVLEQSEANPDILYMARWDDKMFRSDNINSNNPQWIEISVPAEGTPSDIETNPFDENILYITLNYDVYKSNDKGETWQKITSNLPAASKNTIEFYKNDNEGLYVGTDAGIFYRNADMTEWVSFSGGFPVSANVTEIEVYYDSLSPADDLVRASTYGRGLWSSPAWYGELSASFTASDTMIPTGCAIDFYDKSSGVPHQWQWTFEGATQTSSTEKNPKGILYPTAGVYAVTLTVSNPLGSDTAFVAGYITVSDTMRPLVDFSASDTVTCSNQPVYFYDESSRCPNAWVWNFIPATVTYTEGTDKNSQNPVVIFNEPGSYTVSLRAANNAGQRTAIKNNYIFTGGTFLPFEEDFESSTFTANGWTVENTQGTTTWQLIQTEGKTGPTQAAYMNFFNYTVMGARDVLISPLLNFHGFDNVFMTFDYAYAQRYNQKDSLIVKISDDCGETWTRVYANGPDGSGVFETSEPTLLSFAPQDAADWCGIGYGAGCPIIDLSNWANSSDIKIAFESYNQYGNNLYIDNIEISNAVGIGETVNEQSGFSLFPNPAHKTVSLVLFKKEKNSVVVITNMENKEVLKQNVVNGKNSIDLGNLSSGLYFVTVVSESSVNTKKLIIR
jgi:PKD repeat protein